jgi:hypothetical protein
MIVINFIPNPKRGGTPAKDKKFRNKAVESNIFVCKKYISLIVSKDINISGKITETEIIE